MCTLFSFFRSLFFRLRSYLSIVFFYFSGFVAVCSLDCGPNGICESGKCRCNPGYVGNLCDQLPCDARCAEHGQCKNGTCVCSQGWNGRHCTLRKYFFLFFIRSFIFGMVTRSKDKTAKWKINSCDDDTACGKG